MDVVLTWLIQGGLVAVAAAVVLRWIPRSRAQARYGFLWAACVLVLGLPSVPHILSATLAELPPADTSAAMGPVVSMPIAWWTSPALAIGLWIIWFAACAARFGVAVVAVRRTKRQSRECPSDVQARLLHWSQLKATGRRTRVALSADVRAAAVLGCGAPVIALAPSLIEELSDEDLDRVVIHEWAHVQRRDDIAQLVQRFIHTVAGWHPAVWWLGRQLELEREVACDDIAVAVTGCAKRYARCLLTLADRGRHALPFTAVAALSAGLRPRIVRILAAPAFASGWRARAISLSGSVALAALALVVGSVQAVELVPTLSASAVASPELTRGSAVDVSAVPFVGLGAAPTMSAGIDRLARFQVRARPKSEPRRNNRRTSGASRQPPIATLAAIPARPLDMPLGFPTLTSVSAGSGEVTLAAISEPDPGVSSVDTEPRAEPRPRRSWEAAADAGVAVGRGSRAAGVAMAGFFDRFGKKIARSF